MAAPGTVLPHTRQVAVLKDPWHLQDGAVGEGDTGGAAARGARALDDSANASLDAGRGQHKGAGRQPPMARSPRTTCSSVSMFCV